MPTGYTADISKGITFEQYAMDCARAFGAFIHMREDSSYDKPRLQEVSDYHPNKIKEAREELEKWNNTSDEDRQKQYESYVAKRKLEHDDRVKHTEKLKARYKAMLDKAKSWVPPTDDHMELRRFMIDQMEKSMKWDISEPELCIPEYAEWVKNRDTSLTWSLHYHEDAYENEKKSVERANNWIKELTDSLGIHIE